MVLLGVFACTSDKIDSGGVLVEAAPPVVDAAALMPHLEALSAVQVDGTRVLGSSGYSASVEVVVEALEAAGYTPSVEPFEIQSFTQTAPSLLAAGGIEWEEGEDYSLMTYSGSGEVEASIAGVDLVLPPGEDNSSTSGCEASDFDDFTPGDIALIQRGTCTFAEKVANAEAAGAAAVVLFNEGQPGRTETMAGTLDAESPAGIPALGASFEVGEALAAETGSVQVSVFGEVLLVETWNVLADTWSGGDDVLVVGAHLDSVTAGPGINDNGTGTALVLELASQLAEPERDAALMQTVRFAFWGAEEIGLVGSTQYVESLSADERADIVGYLNFDMIGSGNYVRYVYDEDGLPDGSRAFEKMLRGWFDDAGLDYEMTTVGGRSDHAPFAAVGIPAGGLFSGAEVEKSEEEAALYGGEAGVAMDPCYHEACDTLENLSELALDEMAPAAASAVWTAATTTDWLLSSERVRASGAVDRRGHDYWGLELRR